jgi:hypothetical protein
MRASAYRTRLISRCAVGQKAIANAAVSGVNILGERVLQGSIRIGRWLQRAGSPLLRQFFPVSYEVEIRMYIGILGQAGGVSNVSAGIDCHLDLRGVKADAANLAANCEQRVKPDFTNRSQSKTIMLA